MKVNLFSSLDNRHLDWRYRPSDSMLLPTRSLRRLSQHLLHPLVPGLSGQTQGAFWSSIDEPPQLVKRLNASSVRQRQLHLNTETKSSTRAVHR